jgi:hypothetical protein
MIEDEESGMMKKVYSHNETRTVVRDERDDKYYRLKPGIYITNIRKIAAGKGIDKLTYLKNYQGPRDSSSDWTKEEGWGYVDHPTESDVRLPLHYYKHPNIGVVYIKISRDKEDRIVTIENVDWSHCIGILTEAGILLEDGTINNNEKVLDYAKKAAILWKNEEYEAFIELTCKQVTSELDDEELLFFEDIVINGKRKTIGMAIQDAEDILDRRREKSKNEDAEDDDNLLDMEMDKIE